MIDKLDPPCVCEPSVRRIKTLGNSSSAPFIGENIVCSASLRPASILVEPEIEIVRIYMKQTELK